MQMPEELEAQLDAALKIKGYGHVKQKSLEAVILALIKFSQISSFCGLSII